MKHTIISHPRQNHRVSQRALGQPFPATRHRSLAPAVRSSFYALSAFLALTLAAQALAKEAVTVAVFDFESKDEVVRDLGPKVATLISASLSAVPQLITVERAELEKVLGEQELSLSGTVAPATAAKLNQLTGAKVLVTGRVFKVEKELLIVAKIIGTETSRVYGELVKSASKPVTDLSAELSEQIAKTISSKSDTLLAKTRSRGERIEAIKKSVQGKARPVVSVRISERHVGGRTIDPAVETELGLILSQCGFPLADNRSDARASLEVVGDAFSEFGLRKGNLVSCKARVEIKVRAREGGKVLGVDRQTAVAVDLAEQIAAKNALEAAALDLAERVVPLLAKSMLP